MKSHMCSYTCILRWCKYCTKEMICTWIYHAMCVCALVCTYMCIYVYSYNYIYIYICIYIASVMLGLKKKAKTSLSEAIAMEMSALWIKKNARDMIPGFRLTQEPIYTYIYILVHTYTYVYTCIYL